MPDRRELHFTTLDQVLTEANKLADADKTGRLKTSGTWTLGQTLGHLADWATAIHDGTHPKVPFILVIVGHLLKNRMLNSPMKAGAKIPGIPGGTTFNKVLPLEQGLSRLARVGDVIKSMPEPIKHPFLGKLTREQYTALTLRHCELHLSFFQVQ